MPRVERGFLLGSLVGPVVGLAALAVDFIPGLIGSLGVLPFLPDEYGFCDVVDLTFNLALSSIVGVIVATVLAGFIAKQRNANKPAEAQLSVKAAAIGAGITAALLLTLITTGSAMFICTDPLAV